MIFPINMSTVFGGGIPHFQTQAYGSLLDSFTHVVYFTMNIANKMPADPFSPIV